MNLNPERRRLLLHMSGYLQALMKTGSPELRAAAAEENEEVARRLKEASRDGLRGGSEGDGLAAA